MTKANESASKTRMDIIKDSTKKAALEGSKRMVVRQVVEKTVQGVTLALAAKGTGETSDAITAFAVAHPKKAEALVKLLIGLVVPSIDQLKDNKIAQFAGEECFTQGFEDVQSEFLSGLMDTVVPSIMSAFEEIKTNPALRMVTGEEGVDKQEDVQDVMSSMVANMANAAAKKVS